MSTTSSNERISLAHGHGGLLSHNLIREIFLPNFTSDELEPLDDAAVTRLPAGRIAISTDSFVVQPIFFPGGDIGKLAVAGTVNDIAVMGAKPLILSVSFIIEEGFLISDLKRIIESIDTECKKAGVRIVTGDTKVVPVGAADGIFINTTGIGVLRDGIALSGSSARAGQSVILTGTAGDHGAAVICARNDLGIKGEIQSDCSAMNDLIEKLLDKFDGKISVMRDPTRGGVATTLNEIARASKVGIEIFEQNIPIRDNTRAVCEILGFDPLYLANEGAILVFIDSEYSDKALEEIRSHENGKNAVVIGRVIDEYKGKVILTTGAGGRRIMDMLSGEMLPRIC